MIDYTPKKPRTIFTGFSNKYSKQTKKVAISNPVKSGYSPRETIKYPSRVTAGGGTSLKDSPRYTGDKMLGVTILHKSCLQPVFNSQEAIDAASMRR